MSTDHLRRALAESPDDCLDARTRWALVFRVWWGMLWRLALVGGLLNAAAALVFGMGAGGETRAGNAIGGAIWLLVSLWAMRRIVRTPWPWVFRCWWALFWRSVLVGGGVFSAASWALDSWLGTWVSPAGTAPADPWLAAAVGLPASLWAARGAVLVIERKYSRVLSERLMAPW